MTAQPTPSRRPLPHAISVAAARTATLIAESNAASPEDVERQLAEATTWMLRPAARDGGALSDARPPSVPPDCVDTLRAQLLAVCATRNDLDGAELAGALSRLEDISREWRRREGRLMSGLSGSECVDAVVAIAHDLRSPLSSILILLDSLRRHRGTRAHAGQDRQLGLIYGAAHELTTLVSDLIDASRGERLLLTAPMPMSVTEVMLAVTSIVQPICEERRLPLHLQAPTVDARIGHAAALHRVLLNLTSNALRYTDTGSVSLGCTEVSATALEFWVADTGTGLPKRVLDSLHDGFWRDGSAVRFSSAGLGLKVVRALLDAMGSAIDVQTGPDGTRFSFVLELSPVH